ncbi:MAG TPA: sulfotransferase [Solirubrobacterales bacterium]|nr:sulfotransferase [Solirubrobacterales bacterium]
MNLVFVGGTGRSGTHIVGRLLGEHAAFADVPIEARFHCNKRGLPDLLEGRVSLGGFVEKLRDFWWHRIRVDDQPRGLYSLMLRRDFDDALERFEGNYRLDPIGASRTLYLDLLGPLADEEGKPGLVEMSSHNVKEAQMLRRLFPEAKMIHTVRDGRDAASSVTTKTWGPDDVVHAIDWWADRLRSIDRGVSGEEDGARYCLPADRFHLVVLDDLVVGRRDAELDALCHFLGVEPDDGLRDFFDGEMSAAGMHRGRWAEGAGTLGRARVIRRYERTLSKLSEEGNHVARPLQEVLERLG